MTELGKVLLALAGAVLTIILAVLYEGGRKSRWNKRREALIQEVYRLTPDSKPLFVYNVLQGRYFALTTFDKITDPDAERIELATAGGGKVLVNRTASISLVGNDQSPDEIFEYFIEHLLCEKGDLEWGNRTETWDMVRNLLFRLSDEIYIQIGTKVPTSTSRTQIERLNTNCFAPSDVWQALKADVSQSVKSRAQAG